mmetsp:Transcript_26485/g.52756  ORF Transcript_26485/g.52756 Transcript_26485/m.52756 type:complete len:212 (+) Transcript_26485:933-1568(+)
MEPVHVLPVVHGAGDAALVDVGGERQLDEDAVDFGVSVELSDHGDHLVLGHTLGIFVSVRCDARLLARLLLHAHVGLGVAASTDKYYGEARHDPIFLEHFIHILPYFRSDARSDGLAVDVFCHHSICTGRALPQGGQLEIRNISDARGRNRSESNFVSQGFQWFPRGSAAEIENERVFLGAMQDAGADAIFFAQAGKGRKVKRATKNFGRN